MVEIYIDDLCEELSQLDDEDDFSNIMLIDIGKRYQDELKIDNINANYRIDIIDDDVSSYIGVFDSDDIEVMRYTAIDQYCYILDKVKILLTLLRHKII